jgi:hypothetical protein
MMGGQYGGGHPDVSMISDLGDIGMCFSGG